MRLVRLMTATLLTTAGLLAASESRAKTTDACMRMDLELTWLLEEHGERGDVRSAILAKAAFDRQDARAECEAGHEEAALMIYEAASASIVHHQRPVASVNHMLSSD